MCDGCFLATLTGRGVCVYVRLYVCEFTCFLQCLGRENLENGFNLAQQVKYNLGLTHTLVNFEAVSSALKCL